MKSSHNPAPAATADQGEADAELNVCLASPLFYPEYSGSAMRFHRYIPGLRRRGIRVDVWAAEPGTWKLNRQYKGSPDPAAQGIEAPTDLRINRVPLPKSGLLANRRAGWVYESALLEHVTSGAERPDLLIWGYELSAASLPALLRLRRAGVPMLRVATVYEDRRPTVLRQLKQSIQNLPYKYLDCVVVGSSVMRENLRELGVRTRIEVIPHGVDLERFRPPKISRGATPVRRSLGLDESSEVVLFAGPLTRRKGVNYLAAAWKDVAARRPQAHLVLVGPEPIGLEESDSPSFTDRVRQSLREGPGADRVIFAGRVGNIQDYFQAADLFVFPSGKEGMPNVVCEAFATGLCTILTPFLGLPAEFGRPGEQYSLVPRSPHAIAESIVTFLADADARERMGRAARAWAEAHLDVEDSLDQYARLCRGLAGGRRPGRRPAPETVQP